MSWETMQLGDFLTLKRGYDLAEAEREEGNVPIVSSSGITGWHNTFKVRGPGVVTGRYGTLGEVYFIKEDFWPLNTSLYVQDFKNNDPLFTAYFLKHILANISSDKAAVPGVNRNDLHARQISVTKDTGQQTRIASILAAYDDLIENNRRRIQLLEASARLLYKEWFVYLRFPGHERVDVVNGVPEGWERKALGIIAPFKYGKGLRADERIHGSVPVYGSSGVVGFHNKPLVQAPGIIVGRKGNVGSVYWSAVDYCPIDTVYYVAPEQVTLYLFFALLHTTFMSTDVAVPGLNRDYAHSRQILVPSSTVLQAFEDIVLPIYRQMESLRRINEYLATARDLLLPRLMNGEVTI